MGCLYSITLLVLFQSCMEDETFLIICRDTFDTPDFVRARIRAIGLNERQVKLVVLNEETLGQAATVDIGISKAGVKGDTPVTIFNIDTFRPKFSYPTSFDLKNIDGYLEAFEGEGDHWSFLLPEPGTDLVLEVAEKKRISSYCSNGLYHFKSAEYFRSLYREMGRSGSVSLPGNEHYIAPLYNIAIGRGADIRYVLLSACSMRFCGTPDEYETLRSQVSLQSPEMLSE